MLISDFWRNKVTNYLGMLVFKKMVKPFF